jgi:hypothetical protein
MKYFLLARGSLNSSSEMATIKVAEVKSSFKTEKYDDVKDAGCACVGYLVSVQ